MHHLYRTWPNLGLEDAPHQWFDRSTWPSDFVGIHESDYYAESITKRLLTSTPSLADALEAAEFVSPQDLSPSAFTGRYHREPVQNDWHRTQVAPDGDGLRWTNAAGVSWAMVFRDGGLFTTEECPYGVSEVSVEAAAGQVTALWLNGEAYRRQE